MRRIALALALTALVAAGMVPASSAPVPFFASDNVELIGTLPIEGSAISAQIREVNGTEYFLLSTSKGISAYDISNPALPVLAGHLPLPNFEGEDVDGAGDILLVDVDPGFVGSTAGGLYVLDVSNLPLITFAYTNPATGNRFKAPVPGGRPYNGGHTINCVRADCSYAYDVGAGGGSNRITVIDLRNPSSPQIAGQFISPVGGTHDVEYLSDSRVYMHGAAGVVELDTTTVANPTAVSAYNPPGLDYIHNVTRRGNTLLVTEEDWLTPTCDSAGRFATFSINGSSMQQIDVWEPVPEWAPHSPTTALVCGAHWFEERNGIVSIAWYQLGTYFLDVSNPADIKEVGYFVAPGTATWASYWVSDDIVYTVDATHGVSILRFDRSAPAASVRAPAGLGAALATAAPVEVTPHPVWGYACSIPKQEV